jgi:hypothetical protein
MEKKMNEWMNGVVNVVKEEFQLQSQSWNTYGQRVSEKVKGFKDKKVDLPVLQNEVKEEAAVFLGELKSNLGRSISKLKAVVRPEQAN